MSDRRNINLAQRVEDVREKNPALVVKFEVSEIEDRFLLNIDDIKKQFVIADKLEKEKQFDQAKDIWRSQVVFLASAFDFFMHEMTKCGLANIFEGEWAETEKYCNIKVDMRLVVEAIKNNEDKTWFLTFVNKLYADVTMMSYTSVKNQLNIIGLDVKELADKAFYVKGSTTKTLERLKTSLDDLFSRRNLIAHQSDREHHDAIKKNIVKNDVNKFIDDIEKIVIAICDLLNQKS